MSVSITRMLIGIVITNAPLPLNWKDPNSRSFCNGTESRGVVHEAIKGTAFSKVFEWPMKRSQVDLHKSTQRSHWNRWKADLENEIGRKAVNISNYVLLLLTILFRGGRRESEFRQVAFYFPHHTIFIIISFNFVHYLSLSILIYVLKQNLSGFRWCFRWIFLCSFRFERS